MTRMEGTEAVTEFTIDAECQRSTSTLSNINARAVLYIDECVGGTDWLAVLVP